MYGTIPTRGQARGHETKVRSEWVVVAVGLKWAHLLPRANKRQKSEIFVLVAHILDPEPFITVGP